MENRPRASVGALLAVLCDPLYVISDSGWRAASSGAGASTAEL
jgi:hypothetical protein